MQEQDKPPSFKQKLTRLASEHRLFLAIFLILIILRLPLAARTHEFVLLAQDHNATNFGFLYLNNDLPKSDGVDVGENKNTFVLSNAYYYVPYCSTNSAYPLNFFMPCIK